MGKIDAKKTEKKVKKNKVPMSKKTKIILSSVISAVAVVIITVGLVIGLTRSRSVFDYLKLKEDLLTKTYSIVDVSSKLKGDVTIPEEYKGKKITVISDEAFANSKIEKLTLPNTITSFGNRAFMKAKHLKQINTPESLEFVGKECFYDCDNLTSFDFKSIETIKAGTFKACDSLNSFDFANIKSIEREAFSDCDSLEIIEIGSKVNYIGGSAFGYCSNLKQIKVKEDNSKYQAINNCIIDKDTNELISGCKTSVLPNTITIIGEGAFEGIESLYQITLPASVTEIKACAFYGCSRLGENSDGFVDISNVKKIGRNAFSKCLGLLRVELSGNIEELGFGVFSNCENLKTVVISATNLKNLPHQTFYNCKKLDSVTISGGLETIKQYAFANCIKLKSLTLPASITTIEASAFDGCVGLTSLYIPSTVLEIQDYAFYGCSNDLTLLMQVLSKPDNFDEKWNYNSKDHELTTIYGQTAN